MAADRVPNAPDASPKRPACFRRPISHSPTTVAATTEAFALASLGHLQEALGAYQRWTDSGQAADQQAFLDGLQTAAGILREMLSLPGADELCDPVYIGSARIGQRVSAGDHYVTVLGAEQWPGEGFTTPRSGHVFLTVEVELEAIKFGEPFLLSSRLVAPDGSEYRRELLGRTPDVVSLPEMSPGDRERAYFTFEVPAGSLHGLVLLYQLGLAGPQIEFALD